MMNRFFKTRDELRFSVYYGTGLNEYVLGSNIAILEPMGQRKQDIEFLKERHILPIAYLSVMEASQEMPVYSRLIDEDFFYKNGDRLRNGIFGTNILDLRSAHIKSIILEQAGKLISDLGFAGFFLDTIGDIESGIFSFTEKAELMDGAVNLVRELRASYPSAYIIQNNGLNGLINHTAPYINAVCWENPPLCSKESSEWVKVITSRLMVINKDYKVTVMLLIEKDNPIHGESIERQIQRMARKKGFVCSFSSRNYI